MEQGLLHIYCGNGKGKTTAAVGLGVRACGAGLPVLMAQFLKDGTSSELNILRNLPGFTLLPAMQNVKFTAQMNAQEREDAARQCAALLDMAFQRARAYSRGLLILDEALGAAGAGLLPVSRLVGRLNERPPALEVVLTGRNPARELVDLADYVTEMAAQKHPFAGGVRARRGIEY